MGNILAFGLFVTVCMVGVVWFLAFVRELFLRVDGRELALPFGDGAHRVAAALAALALVCALAATTTGTGELGTLGKLLFLNVVEPSEELYIFETTSGKRHRVTHSAGGESDPAWSPDGLWIAFAPATDDMDHGLDLLDVRTRRRRMLTAGSLDCHPAWSPDGRDVVFTKSPWQVRDASNSLAGLGGDNTDLYAIGFEGGEARRLTNTPDQESSPDWSPDGTRIVYQRNWPDPSLGYQSAIWVMNADGTGQEALVTSRLLDEQPRWSPDSQQVAFLRGWQIMVVSADGGEPEPLISDLRDISEFDWAVDGSIAFIAIAHSWQDQMRPSPMIERLIARMPHVRYGLLPWLHRGGFELCVTEPGGDIREIAEVGIPAGLRWAPDSARIVIAASPSPVEALVRAIAAIFATCLLAPSALWLGLRARRRRATRSSALAVSVGLLLTIWLLVALCGYPVGTAFMH